jgi:hypothetical protein
LFAVLINPILGSRKWVSSEIQGKIMVIDAPSSLQAEWSHRPKIFSIGEQLMEQGSPNTPTLPPSRHEW